MYMLGARPSPIGLKFQLGCGAGIKLLFINKKNLSDTLIYAFGRLDMDMIYLYTKYRRIHSVL